MSIYGPVHIIILFFLCIYIDRKREGLTDIAEIIRVMVVATYEIFGEYGLMVVYIKELEPKELLLWGIWDYFLSLCGALLIFICNMQINLFN